MRARQNAAPAARIAPEPSESPQIQNLPLFDSGLTTRGLVKAKEGSWLPAAVSVLASAATQSGGWWGARARSGRTV